MMALTSNEKKLVILLRLWMVLFFLASLGFVFFGETVVSQINFTVQKISSVLEPADLSHNPFWIALVMSLMWTLVFICYKAQKDIRAHLNLVSVLLFSKFVSTFFYFVYFTFTQKIGAYLLGCLTDGSIFLITYAYFLKVQKEVSQS